MSLNVAVIMGGTSAERAVSLRSGNAILQALNEMEINTKAIDGVKELLAIDLNNFDAVFNILHGESGENGELAALLSILQIKYTGSDAAGAALSWDKDIAKTIIKSKGLKTPDSQIIKSIDELAIEDSGPWIVKPNKEGSSVGLFFAKDETELKININKALSVVESILVEKYIQGTECTVAIVNNVVLPVVRIVPNLGLYDYEAKYESADTNYFCPSGFNEEQENILKQDAMVAFKALKLKGWARIDFIVDDKGNRWFLEANTTPGMTETSLVPKAAKAMGWDFNKLVKQVLLTAFGDEIHV